MAAIETDRCRVKRSAECHRRIGWFGEKEGAMSAPPLMSGSPPPLDRCDDDDDDEEFPYGRAGELFEPRETSNSPSSPKPYEFAEEPDAVGSSGARVAEEDNNIEDLGLERLRIDFHNCKESAEDGLDAEFDDFGTFFGSSGANDDPSETSYYLSEKAEEVAVAESAEFPNDEPPEKLNSLPADLAVDEGETLPRNDDENEASPRVAESTGDGDFDDFEDFATFQSGEINDILNASLRVPVFDDDDEDTPNDGAVAKIKPSEGKDVDEDDFGDFGTHETDLLAENEAKVEKITAALSDIFAEDEASENDAAIESFDLELTSSLGESWRRLVDHEAEQLYLFPWNSSASQKSLLKSLGIDSRNILFGPKWNTNMPRFAANLGSNPLQPIKRSIARPDPTPDRKSDEIQSTSTPPGKESEWENDSNVTNVDLQASSYAESLLLDLEHLMATLDQMTSGRSVHFKISDLFSTACNDRGDERSNTIHTFKSQIVASETNKPERPPLPTVLNVGRKINLPDTHIFTPTDSETPWSHTIHYNDENFDNFPCNTDTLNQIEKNILHPGDDFDEFEDFQCHKTDEMPENDRPVFEIPAVREESDDFGDFQSANSESSHFPVIDLLEPIKLTPVAPVVNWPEPGEVKSLDFDDFAFVNPSPNELENIPDASYISTVQTPPTQFILKESKIDNEVEDVEPEESDSTVKNVQLEANDDFDDFQSAKYVSTPAVNPTSFNGPTLLEPTRLNDYSVKNNSQQILQPLSLENFSQINWPNPGIDLQDLSRFNPLDSIKSYETKSGNSVNEQSNTDDDGWSDFVSSKPVTNRPTMPNMLSCNGFGIQNASGAMMDDNDDWCEFVSNAAPSKSSGELKTISQNIHSLTNTANSSSKSKSLHHANVNVLPNLKYVSPKSNMNRNYNSHLQDL